MTSIENCPVVIFCGGRGARFNHESEVLPKPLIKVAGKPMLEHIMDLFIAQGSRDFFIPVGYKGQEFWNHFSQFDDFQCNGQRFGGIEFYRKTDGVSVLIVDTGEHANTQHRLAKMKPYVGKERFFLTYGDGLADVNLQGLLDFHCDRRQRVWPELQPVVTITAVKPPGRFGVIEFTDDYWNEKDDSFIKGFNEKPKMDEWINGGFMVVDPMFIEEYCSEDDDETLESGPLFNIAQNHAMMGFRHDGYWACMDTRRDLEQIEEDVRNFQTKFPGRLPWRYDHLGGA